MKTIEEMIEKLDEAKKLSPTTGIISQADLLKQTELLIEVMKEMQGADMEDDLAKILKDPDLQKHTKIVEDIVKKHKEK